jgi:hypothetical protein
MEADMADSQRETLVEAVKTLAAKATKMSAASKIARHVELCRIRVIEMSARQSLRGGELPKHVEIVVRTNASLAATEAPEIEVDVKCGLAARPDEGTEGEALIGVDVLFRLDYALKSPATFTQEEIDAFGELNGVYNAWPYWRECVQSTLARMGLPTIVVPVFRPTVESVPRSVVSPAAAGGCHEE